MRRLRLHLEPATARTVGWLLPVFATLVLLLGQDLVASYHREFQIHEQEQATLGQAIERHVSATIDKIDIVLQDTAQDFAPWLSVAAPTPDTTKTLNRDLLRRERMLPETEVHSLKVIDAEGRVIFSAGEDAGVPSITVGDRAYFRRQRDHANAGLVISEPLLSRFSGQWLFTLSRRIDDAQGRFLGVVRTAVRTEHFESEFRHIGVSSDSNISLFHIDPSHTEMRLLARRPALPDRLGHAIPTDPLLQSALDEGRSTAVFSGPSKLDGIQRQYHYRKLGKLPLLLSFGRPRNEILSEWYRKAALSGVTLLLLTLQLVWFIAQHNRATRTVRRETRQRHEQHLLTLARSSRAEQGQLQEALEDLARHTSAALGTDVTLLRLEPPHTLVCAAQVKDGALHVPCDPPALDLADHPAWLAALHAHRTVLVDAHFQPGPDPSADLPTVRRTLTVPIRQGSRLLAVAALHPRDANPSWSEDDLSFAASIGELIGQALTAHELQQSLQYLHLVERVMQTAPISICLCTPTQQMLFVNEAFEHMTGHARSELIGQPYARYFDSTLLPEQHRAIQTALDASGVWKGEVQEIRRNGDRYPQQVLIKRLTDDLGNVTHIVRLASDISVEHAQRLQIEHLAYHDTLTGLANRALFTDRLHRALLRAARAEQQVALLFIDVDRFKTINDQLGHEAGDTLLRSIAQRLKSCLRESDTLCRSGGDEFLIICEDFGHNTDHLALLCDRLLDAVAEPVPLAGKDITPSISVGVAIYPRDAANGSDLARNADIAMYQAKEQGRGCVRFFTEELNRRAQLRHALELDLRRALRSDHELYMVYQPQVDLNTQRIVGLEALVRWSPEPGRHIPPDQFIGVAEETRLIEPLGQWIIDEVLAQIRRWQDGPLAGLPVAINVSPVQLRHAGFVEDLVRACARHGVSHPLVELEITESVFIGNVQDAPLQLQRIKDAGFRLALDDFGTGYSSFSYLTSLPLDALKVDRAFIADIGHSAQGSAVLRAIIAMAEVLGLELVAEGVETEAQAAWLQQAGHVIAQGYHFFKPSRAEDLLQIRPRTETAGDA